MMVSSNERTKTFEPIFKTELGELYCADALEFMDYLAQKDIKFQLIFADPPYNIGKAEWDKFQSQDEYLEWTVKWVNKAGRLLKNDGSLLIMGIPEILAEVLYVIKRKCPWIKYCRWLVWHYRNKPNPSKKGWVRSHEGILHIAKSTDFKFYQDRIREPYNAHTLKYPLRSQAQTSLFGKSGYVWEPNKLGAKPRDVLIIPAVNNPSRENVNHPTQKPEELLRKFVLALTDEGDLVYDPFGGSGTTYVVCEQLRRRWIGTEINPEYCQMAINRLKSLPKKPPEYWIELDLKRELHRMKVRGRLF